MTDTLTACLWRLSEAGPGAVLTGPAARRHPARAIDRLFASGVLEELAPATEWAPCADCECALGFRPIRDIDGRIVACCPLDPGSDLTLDPEDLRGFRVDPERFLCLLAQISGLRGPVEALGRGLWRLGRLPSGRAVAAALPARALRAPGAVLLLKASRGPVTLLARDPDQATRLRLLEAGIELVEPQTALRAGGEGVDRLDPGALEPRLVGPRLLLERRARRVTLDGRSVHLSEQLFELLSFLAAQALAGPQTVDFRTIEDRLWGAGVHRISSGIREPIRALRDALAADAADRTAARSLIENTRNPNGYRLALPAAEIGLAD